MPQGWLEPQVAGRPTHHRLARPQPTTVVCLECGKTAALELTKYAGQETWPKECPAGRKLAVYAYTPCSQCGKPVPLKDPQTGGYGRPRPLSALSQRKWQP